MREVLVERNTLGLKVFIEGEVDIDNVPSDAVRTVTTEAVMYIENKVCKMRSKKSQKNKKSTKK